ncbi:hypothetical protein RFH42_15390 [Acinetobacter rudis]|uniref:hypothetical protein n=1 Tax=Acinetobacter rudis TaxID=632955 RepID=UPI00280F8AC0|nr:hypothetical protein [Acinetobacter rudis]MDQ8954332.1 hypothetical protein [Acinetobacter rudis]
MSNHSTKQTILMVTTFTISPLFSTFIVALIVGLFSYQAYGFADVFYMVIRFSLLGLALYFLPATLIGIIFNKQFMPQDKTHAYKIFWMSVIGFVIAALWATLFAYFYVVDLSAEFSTYISIILLLGVIGGLSAGFVTALLLKFLLSPTK